MIYRISDRLLAFRQRGRERLGALLRHRSLIGEILALQLVIAVVIGLLALASFWWASNWIVRDYTYSLSEQWLDKLDELGMPLYVSADDEKYVKIEDYVDSFREIAFVRYYDTAGSAVFSAVRGRGEMEVPALDPVRLVGLTAGDSESERYTVETKGGEVPLLRIGKPIWTKSLLQDGLLGFEFGDADAVQETLVGFVELGLDFSNFWAQLRRNVRVAALIGVGVILLLTLASWFVFRRALLPLSHLQQPLRELAEGKRTTSVETSGHKEIVAIADALNTTVTALHERDRKLWQLANHDPLTGLINRHRFSELLEKELEAAKGSRKTNALLFIDLDQFKYVNDMFGHAAGDTFLTHVAHELRASVRKDDTVSRFGGDEFTILIRDVDRKEVEDICAQLLNLRDHRLDSSDDPIAVRCSIGVTMIRGSRLSPAEILGQADMACHRAKMCGRHQFQVYKASSREMTEMAAEIGWSQEIQKALKEDNFVLNYQPIVDIATGEPTYYEALLRLKGGPRKLIPPSAFLPAANRFGLMSEVDQWVIRNVVKSLAEFRRVDDRIRLTVNVSGCIFETIDPFKFIQGCLKEYDVPLDAIVLEITEQVAVRNMGSAARHIAGLAEKGCRFAIDDFGAGHSSYKYLKHLPVDFIKIDGSFIDNLVNDYVDQRIVSSICEIAEATNCKTVAEHVKDYQTFELLRELGASYAQGFYLGRPVASLKSVPLPVSITQEKKRRKKAG